MPPRYIPAHLIKNLHKYKYAGADHSLLSKYVLQPWWNWLVTCVPMWMAPNLVTLIGFLFIVLNVALTLWYSPDLTTPLPRWCYFVFGTGLFMYQSLDAIDGKQARRTGQSGPLGELFDHGCDALNTTLTVITVAPALGYGKSWWMLVSIFSTLTNFFLTTWEEYHTGVLYLGFISGPVEGIIIVVGLFFVTGLLGPEFWQMAVPFTNGAANLMQLSLGLGIAIIVLNTAGSASNVLRAPNTSRKALFGLLPFILSSALLYVWVAGNPAMILEHHLVPLALFVTFWFGLLVGNIIVAHVVKGSYPYWNANWIPAAIGAGNVVFGWATGTRLIPAEYDGHMLWASFVYSLALYARFAVGVIGDICEELDIWCLTIKHPKVAAKTQ